MKKQFQRAVVVGSALAVSGIASAQAAGPDLTSLTSSVDMGTTITAILAIAATLAGLFVAMRGARTVLSMIKGR